MEVSAFHVVEAGFPESISFGVCDVDGRGLTENVQCLGSWCGQSDAQVEENENGKRKKCV